MAEKYYLAIPTILVDYGSSKKRFNMGDELANVPPDTLVCMIRLGQAVTEKPVERQAPPKVSPPPPSEPAAPPAWQLTPVSDLDLAADVKHLLAAAGLVTIADVLAYGEEHGGLIDLDGIGHAKEKAIQDSIEAKKPQQ